MDFSAEKREKYEEQSLSIGKQEKRIQYTETKAGQIVVSYILLVVVMFSSITLSSSSSSSSVLSQIRWVLFSQILLISTIFWVAITIVIERLSRAKYLYEQSLIAQERLCNEIYMMQCGQRKSGQQKQGGQLAKPSPVTQRRWYTAVFAIVFPLVVFTVLTLYACIAVLLHGK